MDKKGFVADAVATADALPVADVVHEDVVSVGASASGRAMTRGGDDGNAETSNAATSESSFRCVTKYPQGYQIRCSSLEIGMDTCDCDIQTILCFSFFVNLDLDFWNSGFNDKCGKMQLCCLGCVLDTNVCCYVRCKDKDCMCDPATGTPYAIQCCCFHSGFMCKDCLKYDCCRLRVFCFKAELDTNWESCQLCCMKCGETEESVLPDTLRVSKRLRAWDSS